MIPLEHYLYLSIILFCIGAMGVLLRRNMIILFMCIELMLNSANLLLVALSKFHSDNSAQIFVFFVMLVSAAEVSVGLAILVMLYRNKPSTQIDLWKKLKE
ncbi:NADH-quinone oxidoreductase subunit NuoK [Sphingobacteriales bacterium UPWRP_1]|nr:NADH-quinone oxidoreductase subunit K [Sphingobacteriales bacterium TSM_CSS]PSJ74740.1 NADH-quinone oxidoreductase subunit NuoK [Sphingobacteriales bacterium UPWRP_1]